MTRKAVHVLITGGAGYIGSHTSKALANIGFVPVTYDNFVNGHRWATAWGPVVEGDIGDKVKLLQTFRRYEISAVVHFAALASIGESVSCPERYFNNNVTKSLALLDAMVEGGVAHLVFSSSCATYGTPQCVPIVESSPQNPINPYGETKLIIERAMAWYGRSHNLTWAALRYFNAAGADPEGELGEKHSPETHLIPVVIEAVIDERTVEIFGNDYSTPDGTCVRDYVHVMDLADAHLRSLQYLLDGGRSIALNIGAGKGHSVMEVIRSVERLAGRTVLYRVGPRREGDPPILVADLSLAFKVLAWRPQHSDLEYIIATAWKWHQECYQKLVRSR